MNKLLSANFSRLMRDKIFWITAAVMLALSAYIIIDSASAREIVEENNVQTINSVYFNLLPVILFFYSVFISLFIGTEYSDGTIRNKIVIGHSRLNIYFSNYITCFAGAIIILAAMLIGGAFGVPYFGYWNGGIKEYMLVVIVCIFITAALTSILTFVSMLSTNKAITVVISMVLSIVLVLMASIIYNGLSEVEFTREFISMSADGTVELGPEIKNPAYISGLQRKIYEFLLQFLPTGQSVLIANEELTNPIINILYSAVFTVIVNICGVFAFRKKNLK